MAGVFQVPNLNNNALTTQIRGHMHMPTQYLIAGKSLDPLQRTGIIAHTGFPVMPAAGTRSIQGNGVAKLAIPTQPPVVAYAGQVTRRLSHMV
jgi:hypothetical protein